MYLPNPIKRLLFYRFFMGKNLDMVFFIVFIGFDLIIQKQMSKEI